MTKLYLAMETFRSFNEGDFDKVLGVFSSEEKVGDFLAEHAETHSCWAPFEVLHSKNGVPVEWWRSLGEDTVTLWIEEVELDKARDNF